MLISTNYQSQVKIERIKQLRTTSNPLTKVLSTTQYYHLLRHRDCVIICKTVVSNWWHTCDCYFNFFQYTNLHSTLLSQKSAAHSLAHNLYSVKTNHTASAYQQNLPVNLRLHSPPKKEKLHPLEEPKRESKPRMEWKRSRRCRRQFVRSIRRRCIGRADDFIPVKGRRRVSAVEQAALYGAYAIYIRAGPAGLHARLHRYTRRVGPTPVQTGNVWREGSRTDVRPTDGRTE